MAEHAVVVGSGPGGATAAMVLAQAGWDVTVFERGVNYFRNLDRPIPDTLFSNDELKMRRGFANTDWKADPRTFRPDESSNEPREVGAINDVPQTVGGGTSQWDAKTPRFWDLDFEKLSMLGPIEGADVVDWPFAYGDLAPYYDWIEATLGVAGDWDAMAGTAAAKHAPRSDGFPLPPGAPMLSSTLLAGGARTMGLKPIPFPQAILSQPYDSRPPCINCGYCSGFGCTIFDRGGALIPLRHALLTGRVEITDRSMVTRIVHAGGKATGVEVIGPDGTARTVEADWVVIAAGPIDSARLSLISALPDRSGMLGRGLMFHWFTAGFGIWTDQRIHANRGRDTTHCCDDFCDPDYAGAREAASAAGLPYFRGGVLELGGTETPIDEALQYVDLMELFSPQKPFGRRFKQLMRVSALRDRMAGLQMIAEDLAQRTNRVDLDPSVVDHFGLPAARITYAPHRHELAAQEFYIPKITALIKAAGATEAGAVPQSGPMRTPEGGFVPSPPGHISPIGKHILGGMRMGLDASTSVTDSHGKVWGLENVSVADGSVFPTSGAHNPTLTIFATALRNARAWAGQKGLPAPVVAGRSGGAGGAGGAGSSGQETQAGGFPVAAVATGAAAVAVVAAGAAGVVRARRDHEGSGGSTDDA